MAGIIERIGHPESQYFIWPVRVYYEDTDAGGVVYHSNYLKYMERARTEYLRSLGFGHTALKKESGVIFVVRNLNIDYIMPANFDDEVAVYTRVLSIGRSLIEFEQIIIREHELLTEARIQIVCIDAEKFKPVSIPPDMRECMPSIKS